MLGLDGDLEWRPFVAVALLSDSASGTAGRQHDDQHGGDAHFARQVAFF